MHRGMPLKVSYGMGVDSTAMLIEMHKRGVEVDLILFADTGGEKRETYAYLPIINKWLERSGMPPVIVVKRNGMDASLYDECLRKSILPSISYGYKSCSLKWKVTPQQRYCLREWPLAQVTWRLGGKVLVAIGMDNGGRDCKRSSYANANAKPDKRYDYWYPLQEWGIDREACVRTIQDAGLPVPPKSSCFFCGSMRKPEIVALPLDLREKAVALERKAKPGLRSVNGLGRRFSWEDYLDELEYAAQGDMP